MDTIFDLVQAQELAVYWETLAQDEAPYPGEELFPVQKKRGLDLKWLKGAGGLPIVLKTSAFDVSAVPRPRIGFEKLSAEMPYFKESTYIDEELRQELNMVLETGNQAYIDAVVNRVFDDEVNLLRGAAATRERMRMMALTTGVITMEADGQEFTFDYGITHKGNVAINWSERTTADPLEDIRLAKEKIQEETGVEPTRAICDGETWRNLRNNKNIVQSIYVMTNGAGAITDNQLRDYVLDQVGVQILVNDKRYKDEDGATQKFVPANTFVLFPEGDLGSTWFGTTPAESDLMSSAVANVSIVDEGVSITTAQKVDPVNVETIVAMICLPSFEAANSVFILDTEGA